MSGQITDIAQILATALAAGGLLLTAYQISRSIRERRIDRVDRVRQLVFGDPDISKAYYQLEYKRFIYNDEFHDSESEKQLDKLLSSFDTLAKQVDMKLLNIDDLDLLAYEYLIIYRDKNIQTYLEFLDTWVDANGLKRPQFESFRKVGEQLENKHT